MGTNLQWSKSGLKLSFETSKVYAPRLFQEFPFPDIDPNVQLIQLELVTISGTKRSGIRITSVGGLKEFPGSPNAMWTIRHETHKDGETIVAVPPETVDTIVPPVDLYEVIPILNFPVDILVDPVMPLALHEFALVRLDGGKTTVWASITIETPIDPTIAEMIALLANVSLDGWLREAEKPTLRIWWTTIQASGLVAQADSLLVPHVAYSAALAVLAVASDAWMGSVDVDISDWNPTLVQMWSNFLIAEENLRIAVQAEINANALAALQKLENMASDGLLTDQERPALRNMWATCQIEKPDLDAKADEIFGYTSPATHAAERDAYDAAYDALHAHESAWDGSITADVDISGWDPSFMVLWSTYMGERIKLQNAMLAKLQGKYVALLSSLNDLTSDGKLTDLEKITLLAWWTTILVERTDLQNLATADGVTASAEYVAFVAAYDSLYAIRSYWTKTSGAWTTPGTIDISAVSPSVYTRFSTYWTAKTTLQNAIINRHTTALLGLRNDLNDIVSDGKLTDNEKIIMSSWWVSAGAEKTALLALAGDTTIAVSTAAYTAAYAALDAVKATTWLSAPGTVDLTALALVPTLYTRWSTLWSTRTDLQTAISTKNKTNVAALNTALADILADGKLSPNEKIIMAAWWTQASTEKTSLDALADATTGTGTVQTAKTNYDNTYTALDAVKATTWQASGTTDISAMSPTLYTLWSSYWVKKEALLSTITTFQNTGIASLSSQLADMASDGILTPNEKLIINPWWTTAVNEKPALVALAGQTSINVSSVAYVAAYNALDAVKANWTASGSTDISALSPTLYTCWATYWSTKAALEMAIADKGRINTESINTTLLDMVSDGKLTPDEKIIMVAWWTSAVAEKPALVALAGQTSIAQSSVAYVAAYDALAAKAATTWQAAGTTDISALSPTLYSLWSTYWSTRSALETACADKNRTNTESLLASLTDITSDGKLTSDEKIIMVAWWAAAVAEKPSVVSLAAAGTIAISSVAYVAAYDALAAKAATTWQAAGTTDISALSPTLYVLWSTYWGELSKLETAISDKNRTNTDAVVASLADITSDGKLSPNEKIIMVAWWGAAQAEKTSLVALAGASTIAVSSTAYTNAYNALNAIAATTWQAAGTTDISALSPSLYTLWVTYWTQRSLLEVAIADKNRTNTTAAQAAADAAAANAAAANSLLADIASDSKLTPDEKPTVILDYTVILAEQSGIQTQATTYACTAVTAAVGTYNTSVSTLSTYLTSLNPAYNDVTQTTTIVGSTFRSKFADVYQKRQILLNAIATQAKAQINLLLTEVYSMAYDGILSPAEKPILAARWTAVKADYEVLSDRAKVTSTPYSYLTDAYNTLYHIIEEVLVPPITDFTQDTILPSSTAFYAAWVAWDAAKTRLQSTTSSATQTVTGVSLGYVSPTGTSLSIDGITPTLGDKYILANQGYPNNGIYSYAPTGSSSAGVVSPYGSASAGTSISTASAAAIIADTSPFPLRAGVETIFSGFSGNATTGTLAINIAAVCGTQVLTPGDGSTIHGSVFAKYSLDGGATWTAWNEWVVSSTGIISINLSGVTLSLLQVKVSVIPAYTSILV